MQRPQRAHQPVHNAARRPARKHGGQLGVAGRVAAQCGAVHGAFLQRHLPIEEQQALGWIDENGEYLGRPVDVAQLRDGSLLVSDDLAGAIYRIWYEGQ